MKPLLTLAAALPIVISASAAVAQSVSYSGNWPVTAKLPPHFGNTGCLTLVDDGTEAHRTAAQSRRLAILAAV